MNFRWSKEGISVTRVSDGSEVERSFLLSGFVNNEWGSMDCLWGADGQQRMPTTLLTCDNSNDGHNQVSVVDVPVFVEAVEEATAPAGFAITISDSYKHFIPQLLALPRGKELVYSLVHAQNRQTGTVLHHCAEHGDQDALGAWLSHIDSVSPIALSYASSEATVLALDVAIQVRGWLRTQIVCKSLT